MEVVSLRNRHVRINPPGLVIVAFGLAMAAMAATYPLGSLLRPGPGFFPVAIGLLLAALGAGIAVEARQADADERAFPWRPAIWTTLGILAFALLLDRAGLVPATVALIAIAASGERRRSWLALGAVCLVMAAFGTALFVWGLGLPVEPFGPS